jgi:hypothetical protein
MFAWSQLNFSVIPVSISAVSLTSRQTWKNVNNKRRLQRIQNVQEGKRHQKKETCIAAFIFVPSVFGEKFPTAEFWNYIARNFWLGNRMKISKCLMRTFTCHSTFLYGHTIPTVSAHKTSASKEGHKYTISISTLHEVSWNSKPLQEILGMANFWLFLQGAELTPQQNNNNTRWIHIHIKTMDNI